MITLLAMLVILAANPATAAETLPFDHVHIAVPDVASAVRWYEKHLEGKPGERTDRLLFGQTRVVFLKNERPFHTEDRVIDHIGFSFPNIKKAAEQILSSGGKRLSQHEVSSETLMMTDPWGTKIELVGGQVGVKIHHVHLRVPDPAASLAWYQRMFGGERDVLAGQAALRFGEVWLVADKGESKPSEGSTFDHIGWRTTDLIGRVKDLQTKSVRFLSGIEPRGETVRIIFLEGPAGIKIELLQR